MANHATVEAELRDHGHGLAELPRILCLSKADLVPAGEAERRDRRLARAARHARCCVDARPPPERDSIACATRSSRRCPPRARAGGRRAAGHPPRLPPRARATPTGSRGSGRALFRVDGGRIERLIARHDIDNDEALRYVEERLRALGVIKALRGRGLRAGRRRGDRRASCSSSIRRRAPRSPDSYKSRRGPPSSSSASCARPRPAGLRRRRRRGGRPAGGARLRRGHERARRRHALRRAAHPGVQGEGHRRHGRPARTRSASSSSS